MNYFKHPTAIVGDKAQIGEGSRIWAFTNIQDEVKIGHHCNICDGCFIENGVVLGNHVTLKNNICVFNGVTLEDDVFCATNTVFINDKYPRSHRTEPWVLEKTLVCRGATLGSNATILCGVTIGEYAVVGAGSVITRDVPAYTIFFGNPAQLKGYACRCGRKLNDSLKCSCGRKYSFKNKELKLNE